MYNEKNKPRKHIFFVNHWYSHHENISTTCNSLLVDPPNTLAKKVLHIQNVQLFTINFERQYS